MSRTWKTTLRPAAAKETGVDVVLAAVLAELDSQKIGSEGFSR